MTTKDAVMILSILRAAYPTFYKDVSADDAKATANLWAEIFADEDGGTVAAAIKSMIATRTSNFPPVIGEVKEALQKMREPDRMTEAEAWAIVSKAAANCDLQNPSKTFDKLPEDIKRVIRSPNVLKEWAISDINDFQTVIASNFQRSYRTIQQRKWDDAKIPESIKQIPGFSNVVKMIGD